MIEFKLNIHCLELFYIIMKFHQIIYEIQSSFKISWNSSWFQRETRRVEERVPGETSERRVAAANGLLSSHSLPHFVLFKSQSSLLRNNTNGALRSSCFAIYRRGKRLDSKVWMRAWILCDAVHCNFPQCGWDFDT